MSTLKSSQNKRKIENKLFRYTSSFHFYFQEEKDQKTKLFTFDSHYTAFSLGKCGGNDCRKPDPVGVPGGLLNFFSEK